MPDPVERSERPLLAVSSTFTAEPVGETLAFWARKTGLDFQVRFAPYNQVFQQLLDPVSLLAGNANGVNVILVRLEDWTRFPEAAGVSLSTLEENVRNFVAAIPVAARSFPAPILVSLTPASPTFLADAGRKAFAARMTALVEEGLSDLSAVHVLRPEEVEELYPVGEVHDPHGDELGRIPYTQEYFAALGTALARKARAIRTAPYKVIVLDCDDTLWKGICGEDGPEVVAVDPPRWALQEFMLRQQQMGMLLCLCSKNNEEDVLETFRVHPEMPLRLENFVERRINWNPKSENIAGLAEELELGLDSFLFVDDNPEECAEVEANCPEAVVLQLPPDDERIPEFLKHVWAFDHAKVTEEDRRRSRLYAQRAERAKLERQATSLEEFLRSLRLEIRIEPATAAQLARVAQLTQRTNQMNASPVRRTESEIQALVSSRELECLTVTVDDRFGSYGLAGAVLFRSDSDALRVDTFLLSCRALGRGVEHRMLARLGEIARERGLGRVEVPFTPSQRNRPALLFLESVGAQYREPCNGGFAFRFPAEYASGVAYRPAGAPMKPESMERERVGAVRSRIDFAGIARELAHVEDILREVRRGLRNHRNVMAPAAAPRTDLERRLAALWAELLHVPSVGVHDNFFDLGGHSLLAVQLLSRVRQIFGLDLSLEIVYGGAFTVAELAKAIELAEIERVGAEDYADLLRELEALSDEEARALLEQEAARSDRPG